MIIERAASLSKGGKVIERVMEIEKYKIGRDQLNAILATKTARPAPATPQPELAANAEKQGFDKVTGRDKLNSFQIHKTKDAHTAIDYDNRKDVVLAKSARTVFKKERDQRLSELFKRPSYAEDDEACRRHQPTNNEHIRTPNDLHSARRTSHSLNFQKQTSRPFDETLRKMSMQVEQQTLLTRSNSMGAISQHSTREKNPLLKLGRVHSFASYTNRQFLTEKQVAGAPEVSGIDSFKINPEKFKSHWKVVGAPKFDKMAEKHLSRYDRDCPHWFTQLAYNPKDTKKSVRSHLDFQTQTLRKQNLVKSTYPIRLAI